MVKLTDLNLTRQDLATAQESVSSFNRTVKELGGLEQIARQVSSARQLHEATEAAGGFRSGLRAAAEAVSGLSTASRLFDDINTAQRAIIDAHAFIGTSAKQIHDLRESVLAISGGDTLKATGQLFRDFEQRSREASALMASLEQFNSARFTLPDMSSLSSISKEASSAMSSFGMEAQRLAEAMASMHRPWLDMSNQLASAHAFARLQGIGAGLSNLQPFANDFSDSLRRVLGDWREPLILTPDLIEYEARARAYEERGFDGSLIDFPDDAFDEVLVISGINHRVVEVDDDTSAEEADAVAAMSDLHLVITQLERLLRRTIVNVLRALHGDKWHRVGLPGGMYDQWMHKKEEDRSGTDLDPIEFCDFTDYERIIVMKPNWAGFSDVFGRKESVQESFYRLHPARLATMHARPLGRADVLFAMVEIQRLMRSLRREQ